MRHISFALFLFAVAFAPAAASFDCPVTPPSSSPVEKPAFQGTGWYGSESLAVRLPSDGQWIGMGPARNYRDKLWFWRRGYDARSEPHPDLVLDGVRLDSGESSQHLRIDRATNAYGKESSAMLVGMEFPSAGCWRVTATYRNAGRTEELTFVVDVVGMASD